MNWYKRAKILVVNELDEEVEKSSPIELGKNCRDCGNSLSQGEIDNGKEICKKCVEKQRDFVYHCMKA